MNPHSTWLLVLPWGLHEPGGVSQVVQNLFDTVERVIARRPLLLVNDWNQREPLLTKVEGRRTIYTRVQGPLNQSRPLYSLISFAIGLPVTLLRLRRIVVAERITQINVHYPGLNALSWLLVCRLGRPRPQLVLSFHGSDLRQACEERGFGRLLWRLLLSGADEVTACSDPLRVEIVRAFGAAAPRVRVINNGVDPTLIAALAQPAPRDALPADFILSLATIERKKGLDVLIDAFALLAGSRPGISLVLAGRVAEPLYLDALKVRIAKLPCGDRVTILTHLEHAEAMRVLARARALALASRQEPFGIVVLEAGVLRLPVVATTACGVAMLLEPEREVLTVPPEDAAKLANALERLVSDDALSGRLGAALHARIWADFTWERIVSQYLFCPDPRPSSP